MVIHICKKMRAAAARLAAALVLFGGSLVGGEALLVAAGGGNVAHAQAIMWEPTVVSDGKIGGILTWTEGDNDDAWGIKVNKGAQFDSAASETTNIEGGSNESGTNNPKTYTFPAGTFTPGSRYWFFVYVDGVILNLFSQLAPQAIVVGKAISISVNFGGQLGDVDATLTWEKDDEALTSWDVEVLQGATTITSVVSIAAAARSQAFGAVFARGADYSFRIRGHNNADTGRWQSVSVSAPATLAAPLTPVLRGLYAGVSLYLVKNSVNSDYVALYHDGAARSVHFSAPASVTVGGVFVHNIAISPEAANAVLVTIWGAHTHGVSATISGASALATARGEGGRIAPTTIRAITVTPVSGSFTDIVFEWDRPANDGGGPVITEISYGGTLTVADSIGSDGLAPRRAITLSSPVFGAAKHDNTSIDEIAVTLRARNGDSSFVSQQTVFNVAADSNNWGAAASDDDPDPEILNVVAADEGGTLYFYVFMDVGGKSEPSGLRIVRAGTNFSGIDTSTHTNANYRLNYIDPGWPPNPVNAFKNIVVGKVRPGKGDIPGGAQVDTPSHTPADYPSGTVSVRFYATGTRNGDWKGFYYELFSNPGALAVEAQPGNAFLQISASAADDGFIGDGNGTLPLNYEYIHPINGNTIAFSTVGAANFSITALANGRAYTVSVRYSNDSGVFSSWAPATASLVVPGPPEILEFLGFDSRVSAAATNVVSLRWNVDFKGAQGNVILSESAATQTVAYSPVGGYHNHLVTLPVDQSTERVYTIFAKSHVGDSGMATATLFVSLGAPSAPLSLSVTVNGEGSLSLSWSAPNNIGGATITNYLVYVNATVTANVAATSTSIQLSGVAFAPNGREYTIGVAAANPRGVGATATAVATAIGKPGAPQSLSVVGGAGIAVFEWTAANNSGSELLGYSITYANSGGADTGVSVAPAATRHTIGELGNGVYTYTMFAFNALGNGAGITAANITSTVGAPLAPQSVGVSPGANQIGIAWGVDETTPNGADITAFLLYSDDTTVAVATLSDAAARAYTFTGLTITQYTLGVAAQSSLGIGARRDFVATPLAVPGAPAMFVATPGFRQISLAWSDASTFGGAISAFYLSGTGISGTVSLATDITSTLIADLTTGAEYAFALQASNSIGIGATAFVTATPPANPPSVPQNLAVTSILNSISLSWGAVADNGDDPAITYAVFVNDPLNPVAQSLTAMVYYFTSLTVGSTVTVGVAARNSGGGSSVALATVVVLGAPAAPQVTIAPANGRVILRLTAPANTGGLALTGYDIVYGIAAEEARATVSRGVVDAVALGALTNGTEYSFVVYAKNRLGGGEAVTATATPQSGAPLFPDNFGAARTTVAGEILVSWGGGTDANGSPINGYIVYLNSTATMTTAVDARAYTLTMLARGQDYTVALAAKNASTMNAGVGAREQTVISPLGKPGEPQNVAIVAAYPTVSITWEEGETYNGAISDYVVNGATLNASARSYEDSAATVGMNVYTLYAVNVGGNGDPVTVDINVVAIAPKAPNLARPQPSETDGAIDINWTAPANDGGADIFAYIIYVNSVSVHTAGGDATSYLLEMDETGTTLAYGTTYRIEVAARNSVGEGDKAADVGSLLSAPGAPPSFTATPGDRQLVLSWGDASPNGADVTAYVLTRRGNGGFTKNLGVVKTYTDGGLMNGTLYNYELYALNSVTVNGATASASNRPGRGPGAPGGFRVSPVDENGVATVMWTAPSDNGGRSISSYNLRYIIARLAETETWSTTNIAGGATDNTLSLSGLMASVVYRFSLQAINEFGAGAWVGAQSGGNQAAELDKAILPVAAAALSRQWSQAINQRLSQVGAVGGGGLQANALGASFGKGQMERGVAELLRKHGGALANGKELDQSALRNFAFSLGGDGAGGGMGAGNSQLLNGGGIWGGASYTNMESKKGETPWKGDNIAYYAGIDRAMDAERRLLAGVMFAHNRLETDYTKKADNSRGEYNLRATGAHPYLLWRSADNASRFWGTFGYGAGEVEFAEANQAQTKRDAKIYSASGGFRRNLWSDSDGTELDGQADFAIANIEVENPGEADSEADSKNFRALLEGSRRVKMADGGEASPFVRAGFRHQSDDVSSKSGWEFAGGWRWSAKGGWNGEFSAGLARLSGGYEEWNANAMLRKNDVGGKGLWLALRPQYGAVGGNPVAASDDLWRAMHVKDENAKERAASLSLDAGYGLFGGSALWRPFVGATVGENAGEYRAGGKWESRRRADMGMSAGVFAKRKPAADEMQLNFAVTY